MGLAVDACSVATRSSAHRILKTPVLHPTHPLFFSRPSRTIQLRATSLHSHIQMASIAVARAYQQSFETHPYGTLAITNGALNALGDIVAQLTEKSVRS